MFGEIENGRFLSKTHIFHIYYVNSDVTDTCTDELLVLLNTPLQTFSCIYSEIMFYFSFHQKSMKEEFE